MIIGGEKIKILHTSDWHIGKKLYKQNRIKTYKLFMDWLLGLIRKEKIEILIIAGDIFDVYNPPHEAIDLYNWFLSEIQRSELKRTFIISGNHDSGYLLKVPKHLTNSEKIKIVGEIGRLDEHFYEYKNLSFTLLPYFKTNQLQIWKEKYSINRDLHESEEAILNSFFMEIKELTRRKNIKNNILVAHHLFGNFEYSGSENLVSNTGISNLSVTELSKIFCYGALGHIHRPQKVSKNYNFYYSGSPYPLRFSEQENKKVNIIEINPEQEINVQAKLIPQNENLIYLKDTSKNIINSMDRLETNPDQDNFLKIDLTYDTIDQGLIGKILDLCEKKNLKLLSLKKFIKEDSKQIQNETKSLLSDKEIFYKYLKEELGIEPTGENGKKLYYLYESLKSEVKISENSKGKYDF